MNKRTTFTAFLLLAVLLGQFFPAPQTASAAVCDAVLFVADVTVPDGSAYSPNASFTKTWRLKNIGTCTWTSSYKLVFVSGSQMGGPGEANLTSTVAPNTTVDLSVNLTAPVPAGTYRGYWQLKNAAGTLFGIGATADKPFWVEIVTRPGSAVTPVPVGEAYDFASQADKAQSWMSGAGILPFPGADGDAKGFALKLDSVQLETGVTVNQPTLLMVPQNKTDGYIQGLYPSLAIQSGDHFQATIGCQFGASACYVTYRIDYRTSAGTKTLWTFKEKYEGLTYNVNLDLSFLAGKNVEFFLLVLASGSPTGDRALWVAPRIVRTGGGIPPTNTPVTGTPPTPTVTPVGPTSTPVPSSGCDRAAFVADVNVPDGTVFAPNASFTKTWRLKNTGTCTWTSSYKLVFVSGAQMGGLAEVPLTSTVAPNTTVDLSVVLTAPATAGTYRGYWQLKNAAGALFGIGPAGDMPFWVEIVVSSGGSTVTPAPTSATGTPVPVGEGYDFASSGASAKWQSGAGALLFPGTDGDAKGFALKLDSVQLETGATVNQPTLLTVPQNKTDGYIQGLYPSLAIQNGDRFQATIGCQFGASACYVTYRIDYRTSAGTKTLWTFKEKFDGLTYNVNLDLSFLAGKNVEFFLLVLASGSPTGDRALWVAPRIVHTSVITPPTATATPIGGNWQTYTNQKYQFQFQYPPEGQLSSQTDNGVHIELPIIAPGTNLVAKYLDMSVTENVSSCSSLPIGPGASQPVSFNGIAFNKSTGQDQGAGQIRQWIIYYTLKGNACIAMGFVLHSGTLGAFPTSIVQFNFETESAVLTQIMSTFTWSSSASTGSYAVMGVGANDVLNMHSGAGVNYPVVDSIAFDANNVMRTGASTTVGSDIWWEVQKPSGGSIGWVNAFYLTEYVSPALFCSDPRVTSLLTNLGNALQNSNGAAFAALINSKHGLDIRLAKNNPPVNFTKTVAASIFTSTTTYDWGSAPGSGSTVTGTFKDVIQPKLLEVYNSSYVWTCNDLTRTGPITDPWPYRAVNFYSLYKPGTPGVELDWRDILAGIEYVSGQPYLFALVNYQWEP